MRTPLYVLFSQDNPEESAIHAGVRDHARKLQLDWDVIPVSVKNPHLLGHRLGSMEREGVLIGRLGSDTAPLVDRRMRWVQWVTFGTPVTGQAAVGFDDASVGRVAAAYLRGAGARSYAVQAPMPHPYPARNNRHRAFIDAVRAFGERAHVVGEGALVDSNVYADEFSRFCRSMPRPVGFFLYHDRMAEYLFKELVHGGIAVPDEAMVLGGSGSAQAAILPTPLSTVRLPFYALGRAAAVQAHRLLSGDRPEPIAVPAMTVVERDTTRPRVHGGDAVLDRAMQRVDRDDLPIPSVTELAGACGVQRQVLYNHFKRGLGVSPEAWLKERALQRAEGLLATTDLLLVDVARRCGIADASNFCRRFKRRFGITPAAFREQR